MREIRICTCCGEELDDFDLCVDCDYDEEDYFEPEHYPDFMDWF